MKSKATIALRDNVQRLMDRHGLSQRDLAKDAGLSQSAIGYLLRYSDEHDRHPTTATVEAIGKVFGLKAWQLLMPEMGDPTAEPPGSVDSMKTTSTDAIPGAGIDSDLLAKSIEVAISAFRSEQRSPSDKALAAAATFVYAKVSTGIRVKQAEKAVKELLAQSAGKADALAN